MNSTNTILEEKIFSKFKKNSWEVRSMGEIATEIISGNEITKAQLGTGNHPAIRIKEIYDSNLEITDCVNFVDPNLIKRKKYSSFGDILLASTSENLRDFGKSCVYLGKEKCLVGNDIKIIKHNQNPKFLAYTLSTEAFQEEIKKCAEGGNVLHLYLKKLLPIQILLPPPEIQQQIVEFLDKFKELEKELEKELVSELENRKTQYEYYKNLIFNRGINEKNWELKSLEEIATEIYSGDEVSKEQLGSGKYPGIKAGDINGSLNLIFEECVSFVDINLIKNRKYFEYGDLLMSHFGDKDNVATTCAYMGKEKCLAGKNVYVIKHSQNPKYLAYALSAEYSRKQIEELSSQTIVSYLYMKDMKKLQIPIPSPEEQAMVVEQLDKLYRIINDIKDGIPMLIQKNREQYNYYKELLLKR